MKKIAAVPHGFFLSFFAVLFSPLLAVADGEAVSSLPDVSFSYVCSATGGTATGWTVSGEDSNASRKMVGPNGASTVPVIFHESGSSNWHPWGNFTAKRVFTIAAYVNTELCRTAEGTSAVIWSMGNRDGARVMLVKAADGSVKLVTATGAERGGTTSHDTATIAADAVTPGYHLFTASFSTESGLSLTMDAGETKTDTEAKTPPSDGFQIGSIYGNATDEFVQGTDIGFAGFWGYDSVLTAEQIAELAAAHPATAKLTTDYDLNMNGKTVLVGSLTTEGAHRLGATRGTMTIPADVEVSVPHLRFLNENNPNCSVTLNIGGTVHITSESTEPNVWSTREDYKGVLFGHWQGTGAYTVTGLLDAEKTYIQLCFTAGEQTLAVDGGTVKTKGISTYNGNGVISLAGNGTIDLSTDTFLAVPLTSNGGTVKTTASATYNQALTLAGGTTRLVVAEGQTLTVTGSVSGEGALEVSGGTVVLTRKPHTGAVSLQSGTLTLFAGEEGEVAVAAGATLRLILTENQKSTGYTASGVSFAEEANPNIVFLDTDGVTVLGEESGITLEPQAVSWTGEVDAYWSTPGNWSNGELPSANAVVLIALTEDTAITIDQETAALKSLTVTGEHRLTVTGRKLHAGYLMIGEGATVDWTVANEVDVDGLLGPGRLIKRGSDKLRILNARLGSMRGLDGNITVEAVEGQIQSFWRRGESNQDPRIGDATVILHEGVVYDNYGRVLFEGTFVIENDNENTAFTNENKADQADPELAGTGTFIKRGQGKLITRGHFSQTAVPVTIENGSIEFRPVRDNHDIKSLISGAGAVYQNTAKTLTYTRSNEFTGGFHLVRGRAQGPSSGNASAFGRFNTAEPLRVIEVSTGATLDLRGTANYCYHVKSAGAIVNSGTDFALNSRQTSILTMLDDLTVSGNVFGLLASGYLESVLDMAGHELTISLNTGKNFVFCNTTVKNPGVITLTANGLEMNNRNSRFDMTGVTFRGRTKPLIVFPEGVTASLNRWSLTNNERTQYELYAEGNVIGIRKPNYGLVVLIQ